MITSIILLLMYFCCFVTALNTDNPGFTSFYDTIMNRAFFVDPSTLDRAHSEGKLFFISLMNSWLTLVLSVAAVIIIINYFMVRFKATLQHVTEITVCLCVSLSIALYYYAFLVEARYELVMSSAHIGYFVTAGLSLVIAVFKIILLVRDHKGVKKTLLIFPAFVLLLFVELFFFCGFKGYRMCKEYSVNYGLYGQEEHVLRTDLEESFAGNFSNQAVDTDEGLFFLDYDGSIYPECIKRMDSNGEISTVFRVTDDSKLWTIGYDDGYLFVNRKKDIIRIDPDTGLSEKAVEPEGDDYISDACVVDGKLYYVIFSDNKSRIMVSEIEDGVLAEPQLYISDINISGVTSYDTEANLLQVYIIGEPARTRSRRGMWQQRAEARFEYYVLYEDEGFGADCPVMVLCADDSSKEYTFYVDGINVYNGKLYYVLLTERGFDICRCDLDGSNSEVIDSADLGVDCRDMRTGAMRIMTGQGKILVTCSDMEPLLGADNDTVYYVTDLV